MRIHQSEPYCTNVLLSFSGYSALMVQLRDTLPLLCSYVSIMPRNES